MHEQLGQILRQVRNVGAAAGLAAGACSGVNPSIDAGKLQDYLGPKETKSQDILMGKENQEWINLIVPPDEVEVTFENLHNLMSADIGLKELFIVSSFESPIIAIIPIWKWGLVKDAGKGAINLAADIELQRKTADFIPRNPSAVLGSSTINSADQTSRAFRQRITQRYYPYIASQVLAGTGIGQITFMRRPSVPSVLAFGSGGVIFKGQFSAFSYLRAELDFTN